MVSHLIMGGQRDPEKVAGFIQDALAPNVSIDESSALARLWVLGGMMRGCDPINVSKVLQHIINGFGKCNVLPPPPAM